MFSLDRNGPFKKTRKPGKIKDYCSKGKKNKKDRKKQRGGHPRPDRDAPSPPRPPPPHQARPPDTSHRCGHLLSDLTKYFTTLSMAPSLDLQTVDRAYRQAARIHHPDKGGNPEDFRRIKQARDTIADKLNTFFARHQRK